jgi:fucose permease
MVGLVLIWSSNQIYSMGVGTVLFGLSIASIFPSILNYANTVMRLDSRINGYFFAGGSLGAMIIPYFSGVLFEKFGPYMIIYATAIPQLIALSLLWLSQKKLQENKN